MQKTMKKTSALLLAALMLFMLLPAGFAETYYSNDASVVAGPGEEGGPGEGGPGGEDDTTTFATSGTMDHIEIEVYGTVTVVIDGVTYTIAVEITTDDTFTVTATQDGAAFTDFTYSGNTTGDGDNNGATVELTGSYPTGTVDNPVYYTITVTKTVTITTEDGETIELEVTLSVTTSYWASNNNCPSVLRTDNGYDTNNGYLYESDYEYWKNGYFVGDGSGIDVAVSADTVTITNYITVTVVKVVEGEMGDADKEFDFYIDASAEGDTADFTLSDGESYTFKVRIGEEITITEDSEDYDASYEVTLGDETKSSGSGGSVTYGPVTADDDGLVITITNTKDAVIDTGVVLDSLPYALILLLVAAVAAVILVRRIRRRGDD